MDLFDLIRLGIRFELTTNLGEVYLMNYLHTESVKHLKLKNNVSGKGTNVAILWVGRTQPLSQFNDKYNKQT